MTTNKIILSLIIFGSLNLGLGVYGASAQTPTATNSATILRDSVKQKVAEELSEIKQSVSKKGFLGTISSVGEASITLQNHLNQSRNVIVTNDSVIRLLSGKDGTFGDLKSGNFVLAMGDVDSQNQMTAKRLLVVAKPAAEKRQIAFGTVTSTTSSSFTIQTSTKSSLTIKTTSSTKYQDKQKSTDIKSGVRVGVIYTPSGSTLSATRLYVLSSSTSPSPTP